MKHLIPYKSDDRSRLLNGAQPARVEYAYDTVGRLVTKRYGDGTTEQLAYNTRGWLTAKESEAFKMKLRYEAPQAGADPCYSGNISEWQWQQAGHDPVLYTLDYDPFSRLTAAVHKQTDGAVWKDAAAHFTERGITYDRNGNILTLQRTAHGSLVDDLQYDYEGNRLAALTESVRTGPQGDILEPGSAPQAAYAYDANGNLIKDDRKALTFTYNTLNLLENVKSGGNMKASYRYLADGTKLALRGTDSQTGYDYDGSFVYAVTAGVPTLETAHKGDVRLTPTAVHYALTDQLGSVRALVDNNGQVVEQNDFYPFGARHAQTGYATADNRFLFSGKERQDLVDVDKYDFGARVYDAALARWMTVDPLGEKYRNCSPYMYCLNNPTAFIDPDGRNAMITIQGNTITITALIVFWSPLATSEWSKTLWQNIMDTWGTLSTYTFEGMEYNLIWDIHFENNEKILFKSQKEILKNPPKCKWMNYMEVTNRHTQPSVTNYFTGNIHSYKLGNKNSMGHEFGHMLGLEDKYISYEKDPKNGGKPISKYWKNNIMAESEYMPDVRNLDILLEKPLKQHTTIHQPKQSLKPKNPTIFDFLKEPKTIYYINFYNCEQ